MQFAYSKTKPDVVPSIELEQPVAWPRGPHIAITSSESIGEDSASQTFSSQIDSTKQGGRHVEDMFKIKWAIKGTHEGYLEGQDIHNGKSQRSITNEHAISANGLNQYLDILEQIRF
ncbi:hypothetical protein HAX54_009362 [Datura stramonium]|uniref:Uncharacterized protein n=1 Tax=Datura stramonium TaxID=4076 RepID=A0ABS8TEQ3_DATST|nr:hypothetical protein [Datura stramonium]